MDEILKDVVLAPEGEMFLFQNEDEVKKFFSMTHFTEPEDMTACGLIVAGLNDYLGLLDDEDPESAAGYGMVRVHSYYDEYCYFRNGYALDPAMIQLDPKKWPGFPAVAFIWLDVSFDRLGSSVIRICSVQKLSAIASITNIENFMDPTLVKARKDEHDEHDELCRLEDLRDQNA